jgi:hypothetical protein
MTANEARKITQESLEGPVLDPILRYIKQQIVDAAKSGKSQVINPLSKNIPAAWCSMELQSLLWKRLRNEGYKIVQHDDPDPGHPCSSGGYMTIEW